MNLFNFWKWPLELIEDIKQWKIVNDALKEEATLEVLKKFEFQLRIDYIGRIYTVINVPDELLDLDKKDQVWPWVLEKLRELDVLLMDVRLNDLVYPEVTKLEEYPSYLVVLTPSTESLNIIKFGKWCFNTAFTTIFIILINKILIKTTGSSIYDTISSLF